MAAILIGAALLKGHELATGPVAGSGLFSSRVFLVVLVEFEWLAGVWLLSGLYSRRTWQLSLVCFGAFACVSLYKGLSGDASCGCFGRVSVSPWFTLGLDLAVVLALVVWRPVGVTGCPADTGESTSSLGTVCFATLTTIALLVAVPGALAMAAYKPATLAADGMIIGEGGVVVLEPKKWVGKRFPLRDHIDIGDRLVHGKWIVLVVRPGCRECEELVNRHALISSPQVADSASPRVVILELPPVGGGERESISGPFPVARLNSEWTWFVETPVEIMLSGGHVDGIVAYLDSQRSGATREGDSRKQRATSWSCRGSLPVLISPEGEEVYRH